MGTGQRHHDGLRNRRLRHGSGSLPHRTCQSEEQIVMDGGTLQIEYNETDGHVYMTGPAAFAFEGEIPLPEE